ncbi:MAG TPA: alpha-galactosidase [Microcella sp.]|nr:alpha-galactosidase [Microcella sp.]
MHLATAGASFVLGVRSSGLPAVLHWGAPLADTDLDGLVRTSLPAVVNSSVDLPRQLTIAASREQGWSGLPAFELTSDERPVEGFSLTSLRRADDGRSAGVVIDDREGRASISLSYSLTSDAVLTSRITVVNNDSEHDLVVGAVRHMVPLPARARECLDFTGRWTGERRPQRSDVRDGRWVRASHRGRPGHDASFVTLVGTPHFDFRTGEVWAVHLGWSGNQEVIVEKLPEGAGVHASVLSTGELIERSELSLSPGEAYETPPAHFAWSSRGIDGVTEAFHAHLRGRDSHPRSPRPLVLNTWEAVYFDHDSTRLHELATTAAAVGVERFVLDDGWFRGRRDDTAGLGDWFVDAERWPEGLLPLSRHVHAHGMQFGLWFEPEMVNPDSDVARTRPEWILAEPDELTWRHQFALDFSRHDVRDYILTRMNDVIRAAEVDFVKWDHNRDLHASLSSDGRRRLRDHTLGVYRVIDELRRRHPALEIESCASGGARADWGILSRTDRVWTSDSNDPFERQLIQRWTQTLIPPELMGSHIGPDVAHTTHRHSSFSFRAATALFGHAGIEWDLGECTPDELRALAKWTALYRELRPLLHSGTTVRADQVDDGALLHGVVSRNRESAVFAWVRLATSATAHTARVPIPGLNNRALYQVRVRDELGQALRHQVSDPSWLRGSDGAPTISGSVLGEGIPLPLLNPGQAMLFQLSEVPSASEGVDARP